MPPGGGGCRFRCHHFDGDTVSAGQAPEATKKLPHGHQAQAPKDARPWDKARCVECDVRLVWVTGSGRKEPRWQHERGAR
jgi:hypothetical protein